MRWTTLLTISAVLLMAGNTALAGTIYTWTDADGVKRYSNSQPPEDTDNVQTIDEVQYDETDADRKRQEYNRMVKDANRETNRHIEEQSRKKARQDKARKKKKQDEKARQSEAQRAKLQTEIDAIRKRGYSPTFTKGMQDNLIREVQEKLDQLEGGSGN